MLYKKKDLFIKLERCKYDEIEGGWEALFLKDLVTSGRNLYVYGIQLKRTRGRMNCSLLSVKRKFIIQKLVVKLKIRLGIDNSLEQTLRPLVDFKNTASSLDLQQCYSFLLPDYDENWFYTEYIRAVDLLKDNDGMTTLSHLQKLHELCPTELSIIKCGLARVAAAKPNSADVERLISE